MTYLRREWWKNIIVALIIFTGFIFIHFVSGAVNPAATYCQDLGYEWAIEKTEEGEIGVCKFPDGTTVKDWDFLTGKSGQEWSYCKEKGYELKILSDTKKCSSIYSENCVVCVLKTGAEIEASKLLSFETQKESCGNKKCDLEENKENCPQDCLSKNRPLWFWIISISVFVVLLYIFLYKIIRKLREKRV